uniref:Uncharacterized protein n=1 Tax=Ascaris lumbricoides TaxID=6252 RepID=A0A0M3ISE2_ASCLU
MIKCRAERFCEVGKCCIVIYCFAIMPPCCRYVVDITAIVE